MNDAKIIAITQPFVKVDQTTGGNWISDGYVWIMGEQ